MAIAVLLVSLLAVPVATASAGVLVPPHSDYGRDTDGDLLYNYLTLNVSLDVTTAGLFVIDVALNDSTNTITITFNSVFTFLPLGPAVVPVDLLGQDISGAGIDGPYIGAISLYDDTFTLLESGMHGTNMYLAADFDGIGAAFAGPHTDSTQDTDGDLLDNILIVHAVVDVVEAGTYTIDAALFDSTFFLITFGTGTATLPVGTGLVIDVVFPGWPIRQNGVDGPYTADMTLYDASFALLDNDLYTTTNPYFWTQFDPPSALFFAPHSDMGIDTDGDPLYNILRVQAVVDVNDAGTYTIDAFLLDSGFGFIEFTSVTVTLPVGLGQVVNVDFTGWLIQQNGVDGPYTADMDLYDGAFMFLDNDAHTTGPYTAGQFDTPPARLTPPHSDMGIDTDGDSKFNEIEVNVSAQMDEAGDYIVLLDVWDLANTTNVGFNISFPTLGVGAQGIPVWVSTLSMVSAMIDGPYYVDITLLDAGFNLLDTGFHVTAAYNWTTQFDPIPAHFAPPHSDNGEDRDADTEFNALRVNVSLDVNEAGTYAIAATLWDYGMTTFIDTTASIVTLNPGAQVVPIYFSGTVIRLSGVDGPYNVSMDLIVFPLFFPIDSDVHTTGPYLATDFQTVTPATMSGTVRDSVTSAGIPFANVVAFDYLNGGMLQTNADGVGMYSLSLYEGDWTVLFDDFMYNASLSTVTVAGPTTLNIDLTPASPDPIIGDLTVGPWDTLDLLFTAYIQTDVMFLRTVIDWTFGNRDQVLSQSEWDAFVAIAGFIPPPLNSTWDQFLVDSMWYDLDPGSDSVSFLDAPGPIDSTVPIRLQQHGVFLNPSIVQMPTLTILANVTWDTMTEDFVFNLFLPGGNVLQSFVADPGVTITGVGTQTATADPGPDPNPFDGIDYTWIQLDIIASGDTTSPVANAGPDQTVGAGATVTFDGTGSTDNVAVVNYTWTFTDGATPRTLYGAMPTYAFASMGAVTVTLTVRDAAGNPDTDTVLITVQDLTNPIADAGPGQTVLVGATVTFDGTGSTDNVAVVNYTWTFMDGATPYTLYGPMPTYAFAVAATVTVTLTVRDAAGNTDTDTVTITVQVPPDTTDPVADAGLDQTVSTGATGSVTVTFDGTASTDNVAIVNYSWTFTIGATPYTKYGAGPTHAFGAVGAVTVTLTVRDAAGNTDTDTVLITVQDGTDPVANAGSDQIRQVGTMVSFNGGGSTDNIGVTNYTWTFTVGATSYTKYGPTPTHVFTAAGTITVTLTVRDAVGNFDTDTVIITVTATPPPDTEDPVADAGAAQTVAIGTTGSVTVTFNGSGSTDNVGVVNYTWTFTIGATSYTKYGATPTHAFTAAGTITVTLTVEDAAGNSDTDTVAITVQDPIDPVANAGSDRTVDSGTAVTFSSAGSSDNVPGVLNYTWTFTVGSTSYTLYGTSPTHTFSAAGTVVVTLTVRDATGNDATDTVSITVRTPGPVGGVPGWVYGLVAVIIIAIIAALLLLRRKKPGSAPPPPVE